MKDAGLLDTAIDARAFGSLPAFVKTIKEISKNIVQHSSREPDEGRGYLVVDLLGSKTKGRQLRVTIGDAGRGFCESLQEKHVRCENDFEAIKAAMLYRFHRREGEGLFRVVQFISSLGGVMRVRTGCGEAFLNTAEMHRRGDDDTHEFILRNLKRVPSSVDFPGVQIQIDCIPQGR